MPDPIYIEAVKDVASVMKTADSAAFGKTLGLLLNVVEPRLSEEQALFDKLEGRLNVVADAAGTLVDNRLAEVKELEGTIQGYLAENFPRAKVGLEIPAPDVKTILQAARLSVHDGDVKGPVQTMGDGLKRSVMFALFRTYAELSRRQAWNPKVSTSAGVPRTIVLYEEPELYLHPRAQQVLFDALAQVSQTFQVAVTTHSPLFFSADKTGVFAKMYKVTPSDGSVPFSRIHHVNMATDMTKKDVFQVLCYENCNVAFFATAVLMVEGNSDVVAIQHLAGMLNSDWDFENGRLRIVRVNGKGNLERFKNFFAAFGITALVLADLDIVLDGFDKLSLNPSSPLHAERDTLLKQIDKIALPEAMDGDGFKDKLSQFSWRQRAERFYGVAKSMRDGRTPSADDLALVEGILADELEKPRRRVLREETKVRDAKLALLANLRKQGILVFEKGSLENYYPPNVCGQDKFCKAEDLCKKVHAKDEALALAADVPVTGGAGRNELEAIFARVFWGSDDAKSPPTSDSVD